jgi:hypothetical protein
VNSWETLSAHTPVISFSPASFGVAVPQQCDAVEHLSVFEQADPASPSAGLLASFHAAVRVAFSAFLFSS